MQRYQVRADSHVDTATSADNTDKKSITWPAGAKGVFLQAQGADVWVAFDGENPTVTHKLIIVAAAGATFWPCAPARESDGAQKIRWCSAHASTDATLDAVFVYD